MQLVTASSIKFFHDRLLKKLNLKPYTSRSEPTLFFGMYIGLDMNRIIRHQGVKIVLFNGDDANRNFDRIKKIAEERDTTIIASGKWVENTFDRIGIKHEKISFFLDDVYNWVPIPLGDSLYWYKGDSKEYGAEYLLAVREAFPDLNIIINDSCTAPREEMPNVYAKCFAGIRLVKYDGMSQTVGEMGLMGRKTIWNGDAPCAEKYNDIEDVISIIRRLRKGYNYKVIAKRTRGFFIENETKWAELVLRLCGTNELDTTGIFREDKGRCGSIFRIQKKSDIDKIGGLGVSQFERPWFSEQMDKLGKTQLTTSKNSGFVASEFKSILGDKGYKKGIDYFTRDKRFN